MALSDLIPGGQGFADTVNSSKLNPLNMVTSAQSVADGIANFILQPAGAQGLAGFVFDYEGDTIVTQQSEITDHYTEQNTYVNDHAAQKPARVVLRGYVGEVVANANTGVTGLLNTLQSKLTTLPALLGKYTPGAVQTIQKGVSNLTNTVNKVDDAISRAQNVVGLILGSTPSATKQQKAYQQLYLLWQANAVFTLTTPFNYFKSMIIESMTFTQDETTRQWSDITVIVKEIRFTGVQPSGPGLSPQLAAQNLAQRAAQQGQSQTNSGNVTGTSTAFSGFDFSSFGTRTASL